MKLLIYIRSLVATILFPFTVIILGPIAIVGHLVFNNRRFDDLMMIIWGRTCCYLCGVRVRVEGLENIPQGGCLFLFNHSSFFDIFAMAGFIPGLRYGAKAELFKIPIFAQTMRIMGTLPIARQNRDEVYKIYDEAKVRFAAGEKFALSPEGGRFHSRHHLSQFKAGPFVFAMSAGAPVVPLVILGAYEALPKGSMLFNTRSWRHHIVMKILPPVSTKEYSPEQRRELQKKVYEQMNPHWVKYYESQP